MSTKPSKEIQTFPNPRSEQSREKGYSYEINMTCPEFSCVCPLTGQPDFATIHITYEPDQKCIELKSLKLYLWTYRNEGAFHEKVTNTILDDLVAAVEPQWMTIVGEFNVRGGISTQVQAHYEKEL